MLLGKATEGFRYQKKHWRPVSRVVGGEEFMIQATVRMTIPAQIPAQKSDEVLKIFKSVTELSKDDPGCLGCHLYGDLQEKNVVMLAQVWKAEEDLYRHLRSDEYRNLLLVLEMGATKPEIRFDTVSSSTGIETIEKARNHTR